MIFMLIATAVSLFRIADNIATPCSVNTKGLFDECFNNSNRSQFVTSSGKSQVTKAPLYSLEDLEISLGDLEIR